MEGRQSPRLLLIGLDGATFDLILPWGREGRLPNLQRLIEGGAHGILYSELAFTPPSWSSMYTGKNTGKHGIFHFVKRMPGTYRFTTVNSTDRRSKDIWEILSEDGLRVGVVNAPVTYPPRSVNGFMITGFMTPDERSKYTYPADLKDRIARVVPHRVRKPLLLRVGLTISAYVKLYLRVIHADIERVGKITRWLMEEEKWDFLMVAYSETDNVQHGFWGAMEEEHKGVSKRHKALYHDVIKDVYVRIDRELGRILSMVDDQTYVMVVSDHGGAGIDRVFHINRFLNKEGFLKFVENGTTSSKKRLRRILGHPLLKVQQAIGLFNVMAALKGFMADSLNDVDWTRTRAYSVGAGQIYINLKGREPKGTVEPGEEYEALRRTISSRLSSLRDPRSGEPVVTKVLMKEDIFKGPQARDAPDIQFFVRDGYLPFPGGALEDGVFTESVELSGGHSPNGIFILRGPGVKKTELQTAQLTQVSPTILYLLDKPIPDDMDGGVIQDAFTADFLAKREIKTSEVRERAQEGPEEVLSREEEREVEERLKALGYM